MRYKLYFLLFFFIPSYLKAAQPVFRADSMVRILNVADAHTRERLMLNYIKEFYAYQPENVLQAAREGMHTLLLKNDAPKRQLFDCFIDAMYYGRLLKADEEQVELLKGITLAAKATDHYFLYTYFSHLAFLQTYTGNTIDAVSGFRMARKEAVQFGDRALQAMVDINISDIYYRNNCFSQSLYYLDDAQALINAGAFTDIRLQPTVYYNRIETYFRLQNADSVKKYNQLLSQCKPHIRKVYTFKKRVPYFLLILNKDNQQALKYILALKADTAYNFNEVDKLNLANTYIQAGKPDSAAILARALLNDKTKDYRPETKYQLYEILGKVAESKHQPDVAAYNYKMALQTSADQISKMARVSDISSQIKVDEMESAYMQREEIFLKERLWFGFFGVVAILIICTIVPYYKKEKTVRQAGLRSAPRRAGRYQLARGAAAFIKPAGFGGYDKTQRR